VIHEFEVFGGEFTRHRTETLRRREYWEHLGTGEVAWSREDLAAQLTVIMETEVAAGDMIAGGLQQDIQMLLNDDSDDDTDDDESAATMGQKKTIMRRSYYENSETGETAWVEDELVDAVEAARSPGATSSDDSSDGDGFDADSFGDFYFDGDATTGTTDAKVADKPLARRKSIVSIGSMISKWTWKSKLAKSTANESKLSKKDKYPLKKERRSKAPVSKAEKRNTKLQAKLQGASKPAKPKKGKAPRPGTEVVAGNDTDLLARDYSQERGRDSYCELEACADGG